MANWRDFLKGQLGADESKRILSFFLLFVLALVGVRLWAEGRYKSVPYPNQLAVSSEGVAVQCGPTVYLYSTDGIALRSYALPEDVQSTQLFWENGELYVADMGRKSILPVNGNPGRTRTFNGAAISAQFKVLRWPGTDQIFLSDSANHRILVFDGSFNYQRAFGREGHGPGAFRFPNNMAFDESGRLVIANTKGSSLDAYSPEGEYLQAIVKPSNDRVYRYPTDFAVTPDRLVVLENDGFLERAKVRLYDRAGTRRGELDLGAVEVVGNLVVFNETIFLTDCSGRQLLTYSLADLLPRETFSHDFAVKCADWRIEAEYYRQMSLWSLCALLILCAPVFILYLRIKREETKELSRVNLSPRPAAAGAGEGVVANADLILGIPIAATRVRIAVILMITGFCSPALVLALGSVVPSPFLMLVAFGGLIALVVGVPLFLRSGGLTGRLRKQTELIAQRIVRDNQLRLQPGETMERIALAQHKRSALEQSLLVFTTKRLLVFSLNWGKVAKIEQYPFESIREVQPQAKRFLDAVRRLKITMQVNGEQRELTYHHPLEAYLSLLGEEFSKRIGKTTGIAAAELCQTCLQPRQGAYCLPCATRLAPDWKSLWLSLLYPGLGQLRNGEMQKGLVYVILATIMLLGGYLGLKGWLFEGADVSVQEKSFIIRIAVMAPVLYVANAIDAYRSSIKARKSGRTSAQ